MTTVAHVPPQNMEAEAAVIASCLVDNQVIGDVIDTLQPADFYKTAHQKIYNVLIQLHAQKLPVDLVTLVNELRTRSELDTVGGPSYISDLVDATPMAINVPYYCKIVLECSVRRQLIIESARISASAFDQQSDIEEVLEQAHGGILKVDTKGDAEIYSLGQLLFDTMDRYEKLYENKGLITGVATGFGQLDTVLCGMQPSDLIILAARPSMGKTAMAIQMARGAAGIKHRPLIFSLEQPKEQVIDRMFAAETTIDTSHFRTGSWSKHRWVEISDAAGVLDPLPVFIDDRGGLSYQEIRKAARIAKKKHNIDFIIIDHLQLVAGAGNRNRNDEIGVYTRQFKAMAKELKLPVLVLSQLSRKLEERSDKRPKLSDLRDSGNIEQDADVVIFIYRDDVYNNDSPLKGQAEINIAKQRQGPVCSLVMNWISRFTTFVERPVSNGSCST